MKSTKSVIAIYLEKDNEDKLILNELNILLAKSGIRGIHNLAKEYPLLAEFMYQLKENLDQ